MATSEMRELSEVFTNISTEEGLVAAARPPLVGPDGVG